MSEIRVQYWHNGQPYRLDEGSFKRDDLLAYAKQMQQRYKPFADRINSEGGYLDVTLSPNPEAKGGICFEPELSAITPDLKSEIEKTISLR